MWSISYAYLLCAFEQIAWPLYRHFLISRMGIITLHVGFVLSSTRNTYSGSWKMEFSQQSCDVGVQFLSPERKHVRNLGHA